MLPFTVTSTRTDRPWLDRFLISKVYIPSEAKDGFKMTTLHHFSVSIDQHFI